METYTKLLTIPLSFTKIAQKPQKYTFMALNVCVKVIYLIEIISIRRITIMITLEDWVMIKHLHKEGVPKSRK